MLRKSDTAAICSAIMAAAGTSIMTPTLMRGVETDPFCTQFFLDLPHVGTGPVDLFDA